MLDAPATIEFAKLDIRRTARLPAFGAAAISDDLRRPSCRMIGHAQHGKKRTTKPLALSPTNFSPKHRPKVSALFTNLL
jgi:hypothetical protein